MCTCAHPSEGLGGAALVDGVLQMVSEPTLAVSWGTCGRSCAGMVCMAGVGPEWSHSMTHALTPDTQTWPRENFPGRLPGCG